MIMRGKWQRSLSILAPMVLLTSFSIAFAGASPSGSDCSYFTSDCFSDADCCSGGSSSDDKTSCGELIQLTQGGHCYPLWGPFKIKSGQTDLRCGYKVSWYYNWVDTFTTLFLYLEKPKYPPKLNIDVVAGKTGARKINDSDMPAGINWVGSYNVGRGDVGGKAPVVGTITVQASLTLDKTTLSRAVEIHLTLMYYKLK